MDIPLRNVLCGTQARFRAEVVGSKSLGYVNIFLTQGCSWSNNIWGNMNVQGFISFPCIWDRRPVPRLSICLEQSFWLSRFKPLLSLSLFRASLTLGPGSLYLNFCTSRIYGYKQHFGNSDHQTNKVDYWWESNYLVILQFSIRIRLYVRSAFCFA